MAVETIHDRLVAALKEAAGGGSMDPFIDQLHDYAKAQGVKGVHSTRFTLRRWVSGAGRPPNYWLEIAAKFLGVNAQWLITGNGPLGSFKGSAETTTRDSYKEEAVPGSVPAEKIEPIEADEVAIPAAADVHAANAETIRNFIVRTTSAEAVRAVLLHEPSNPKYKEGRKSVLAEAEKRLAELTEG